MRFHRYPLSELTFFVAMATVTPLAGQVIGPIVGKSEKSDTSPPLRDLAKAQEKAAAEAEKVTDKIHQAVIDFLKKHHPGALPNGRIKRLEANKSVQEALPKSTVFVLRFPQWPVTFSPPKGLQASNLCVVNDKYLVVITNAAELSKHFSENAPKAKSEKQRRAIALAWLQLSQQLHQDGFYLFKTIENDAIKIADDVVRADTEVEPKGGDQGQITVELRFAEDGAFKEASESVSLKAGVRPICQATKLLDPDPIVRRMAERDILVLGSRARGYLLEQRAKAGPELREAIDRAWETIRREDR